MREVKHLSKSAIKSYEWCPFGFFLSKVLGIETIASPQMNRGSEVHDIIYHQIVKKVPAKVFKEQANFVEAILTKIGEYEIVTAEERLTAKYKDLEIVGLIDLCVKCSKGVIIFDYKTGKDRGLEYYEDELATYAFILQQNHIEPTYYGIIYPDHNTVYISQIKPELITKVIAKAYDIWQDIKADKFPRKLSSCRFCDKVEICKDAYEKKYPKKESTEGW